MKRLTQALALLMGLSILMLRPTYPESIPLKLEGGTYVVPVLINGKITLNFTLDSGAAEVSIPADVFGTLLRTDTISKSDLLEPGEYVMADGSTRREPRFRIRSLKVGNLELRDVVASVAPMQGNLLLGQSFLSRMQSWSVDNQRHVLVLNESLAPAPISEPVAHETAVSPERYAPAPHTTEVSPERNPSEVIAARVSPERYAAAQARCRANLKPEMWASRAIT